MNIFAELEKLAKENRSGDPMKDVVNLFLVISLCRVELKKEIILHISDHPREISKKCLEDIYNKLEEVLGEKQ